MEQVFQVTGLCVVGALLALVLKKESPELALLLASAAVAAVLLFLAEALGELLDFLREIGAASGLSDDLFIPLYKTAAASAGMPGNPPLPPRWRRRGRCAPCWCRCRCCGRCWRCCWS